MEQMSLFNWPFVLFERAISEIAGTFQLPAPPRFFLEQQTQSRSARPHSQGIIKSIQEELQEQGVALPKLPGLSPSTYLNAEEWRWKDYRGHDVVITVHRDAKRS
jgi:hypothetical protein